MNSLDELDSCYLDNNATTVIHPEVAAAMVECLRSGLANPASAHAAGRRARRVLEEARGGIAEILGARTAGMHADRVIFTSGGTEANNLVIRGLAGPQPGRLIVSSIEHPSLLEPARSAAENGWELVCLPVDRSGVTRLDALPDLLTHATRIVSIMLGNNETGVLQPVREAVTLCRPMRVPVHSDAVQCIGKIPVHFCELGVDALTVSAHKFHGPVGIGALVIKRELELKPLLRGGFQQAGFRPGTEPVALAVGMHRALQIWHREADARWHRLQDLRDRFEQRITTGCSAAVVIGASSPRLPHTSCIAFSGLDRQAIVMALDRQRIACSTGSACASGSSEPSAVLLEMQLPRELVEGTVRFSFSALTTTAELDRAALRIATIVNDLRHQLISRQQPSSPPNSPLTPV